jgi:hypothetical protein
MTVGCINIIINDWHTTTSGSGLVEAISGAGGLLTLQTPNVLITLSNSRPSTSGWYGDHFLASQRL